MGKMSLSRMEVVQVRNGVVSILNVNDKHTGDFTYFLSKNRRLLTNEYESIIEAEEVTLKAYRAKCKELGIDLSKGPAPEEILTQFKTALDANEAFLKGKVDVDVHTIEQKNVPVIPTLFADWIFPLITENTSTDK